MLPPSARLARRIVSIDRVAVAKERRAPTAPLKGPDATSGPAAAVNAMPSSARTAARGTDACPSAKCGGLDLELSRDCPGRRSNRTLATSMPAMPSVIAW